MNERMILKKNNSGMLKHSRMAIGKNYILCSGKDSEYFHPKEIGKWLSV